MIGKGEAFADKPLIWKISIPANASPLQEIE